ncbi:MAG: SDR family oxidoreductase [Tepidiformaceae bacterium]
MAGGTGTLGRRLVERLAVAGGGVRVLSRTPGAVAFASATVEVVAGDVRDRAAVERAMVGVTTVVSAMHGFLGTGDSGPRGIDAEGNAILVEAAVAAGVEHFVLVSVQGASPDSPMELARMKFVAEQNLRASPLAWTIVRPTAFMETWGHIVGDPLVRTGKTLIFGRGTNPINFVSATDVARLIELAINDPALRGEAIDFGGPQDLTLTGLADVVGRVAGREVKKRHIPLVVMRASSLALRPIKPALSRQIRAGVVMDTVDLTFGATAVRERFNSIPVTTFENVVRAEIVPGVVIAPIVEEAARR